MRIGIFSWETIHSIFVGGVGVHATELAAALERQGHEVHVFTRTGGGQGDYDLIHGVHYHRVGFTLNPDFVEEILNMCRAMVDCFYSVERFVGGFDVIHAHDWLTAMTIPWIKNAGWHKALFTIHSTEYGRCGNRMYGGMSERIRGLEAAGCNSADRVVAVSNRLKEETCNIYKVPWDKIRVIYNGVNIHRYDGFVDQGEVKREIGIGVFDPLVLFAGRMVVQKGPDILAHAIPSVLCSIPNAKFAYAGDGHLRGEVERIVSGNGSRHAVRFLGHRSGEDLVRLFKAADVVCVPSRNEPFGIVVLEGWSAGKPVVATTNGGPSEFVWHDVNGLHISDNPNSVAWGVGTLLGDEEKRRWLGRNGRVAVETAFSWDIISKQVAGAYTS